MHSTDDTIVAIATAEAGSLRGIVRISGCDALAIATRVFAPHDPAELDRPSHACAVDGTLALTPPGASDAASPSLPCTLYLWPTTRSYTRQPVAELHTIGSPPLLAMLLRSVCLAGARLAEPGEFTLRAFLAGRLDLPQAEAVLGVIDAADGRQLDVALAQLAGGLSGPLAAVRDQLLNLLADLEAGLDFTEEDLQFISSAELQSRLEQAIEHVERLLEQMRSRGRAEFEPRVVLTGWSNVGKSSLFNALLGRPSALVSDFPGTTRDYLASTLPLGEIDCRLIDTAGREWPHNAGALSDAALRMTDEQSEQADLRLLCLDSTREPNAWERSQATSGMPQLVVLTKCDAAKSSYHAHAPYLERINTSAITGVGLEVLKSAIRRQLCAIEPATAVAATAIRCNESLRLAAECLRRASQLAARAAGEELIAAEIRASLVELGKVVGTIYTDDILDRVFSRFCIGK